MKFKPRIKLNHNISNNNNDDDDDDDENAL